MGDIAWQPLLFYSGGYKASVEVCNESNMDYINGLKQQLAHSYSMKDFGEAKKSLV